jgi:hypothetical protein
MANLQDLKEELKKNLIQVAEDIPDAEENLDEWVHECKSDEASDINNQGLEYQLEYLIASLINNEEDFTWFKEMITDAWDLEEEEDN